MDIDVMGIIDSCDAIDERKKEIQHQLTFDMDTMEINDDYEALYQEYLENKQCFSKKQQMMIERSYENAITKRVNVKREIKFLDCSLIPKEDIPEPDGKVTYISPNEKAVNVLGFPLNETIDIKKTTKPDKE